MSSAKTVLNEFSPESIVLINAVNQRRGEGMDVRTALIDAGIEHVYYESPGTDHEWQTWRRDLKDFAPRLFR